MAAVMGATLAAACVGGIGGDAGEDAPGSIPQGESCSPEAAFDVPMHRITRSQFAVLVTELFGESVQISADFPGALQGAGYSTYAAANPTAQSEVRPIMDAAEAVAMQVVDLVPACSADETACARDYLQALGTRAFRRPIEDDELSVLMDVYQSAPTESDHAEAVGIAVFAMLQMPQFLYAMEDQPQDGAEPLALDDAEVAQRMALVYWNGLPDDALMGADLSDASVRSTQAARMIADPKGRAAIAGFVEEWLMVRDFNSSVHEPEVFAALQEELSRNVAAALTSENGLVELMTSNRTYVNSVLEGFYGLPSVSTGPDDWREVELDPAQRVGILTHPVLMSRFAHGEAASPILRGQFVRMNLLCGDVPAPPPGATAEQDNLTPQGATPKEQAEARLEHPTCGACHQLMDPIGFGFEAFDGAGRFLPAAADAEGAINAPSSLEGTFHGVRELGEMLAESDEVRACFAKNWLRYAMGKKEDSSESCSVDALSDTLVNQSTTISAMFADYAASNAFFYRADESTTEGE
jgi:Protein of unknown function (DUF1588)/Protein of unknown function (DUF1592)/Protein of unknown function (DUF1595)/Protein of unknown function (DUF1585)/Protein of unknown function (DUF1587)